MQFMIGNDWDIVLKEEFKKDYFYKLLTDVNNVYRTKTVLVYPVFQYCSNQVTKY